MNTNQSEEQEVITHKKTSLIAGVVIAAIVVVSLITMKPFGIPLSVLPVYVGDAAEKVFAEVGHRSLALSLGVDLPKRTLEQDGITMSVYVNGEAEYDYSTYNVRPGDEIRVDVEVLSSDNKSYVILPWGVLEDRKDLSSGLCELMRDWYYVCSGGTQYSVSGVVGGAVGLNKTFALYVRQTLSGEPKTDILRRKMEIYPAGEYTHNEILEKAVHDERISQGYVPPTFDQSIAFLDVYDQTFPEFNPKQAGEYFENHFSVSDISQQTSQGLRPLSPGEWESFKSEFGYWQSYSDYLAYNGLNVNEWSVYFIQTDRGVSADMPAGKGSSFGKGKRASGLDAYRIPAGKLPNTPQLPNQQHQELTSFEVTPGPGNRSGQVLAVSETGATLVTADSSTGNTSGGGSAGDTGNSDQGNNQDSPKPPTIEGPLCPEDWEKLMEQKEAEAKKLGGSFNRGTYDDYLKANGFVPGDFWRDWCKDKKNKDNGNVAEVPTPKISLPTGPDSGGGSPAPEPDPRWKYPIPGNRPIVILPDDPEIDPQPVPQPGPSGEPSGSIEREGYPSGKTPLRRSQQSTYGTEIRRGQQQTARLSSYRSQLMRSSRANR